VVGDGGLGRSESARVGFAFVSPLADGGRSVGGTVGALGMTLTTAMDDALVGFNCVRAASSSGLPGRAARCSC
jgi:hypothetical protein